VATESNDFVEKENRPGRKRRKPDRINYYDLEAKVLHMGYNLDSRQNRIGHNFGFESLYVDGRQADINDIETSLSKLENAAAVVLKSIVDRQSAGQDKFTMGRGDLNCLRKFLFISAFRNPGHAFQLEYERFDEKTAGHVHQYMSQHGLGCGREVWLNGLDEILRTPHWDVPNNKRILHTHRMEYSTTMERPLIFWEASGDTEFVLVGNSSSGFEETSRATIRLEHLDAIRKVHPDVEGTDSRLKQGDFRWLELYPVTPRLVAVLVFEFLAQLGPSARLVPRLVDEVYGPKPSQFEHFPFPQCHVEYKRPPPTLSDQSIESRIKDEFKYSFGKLSSNQVHQVNSFFLKGARLGVGFKSITSLYKTIKRFKVQPKSINDVHYRALMYQIRMQYTRVHIDISTRYSTAKNLERSLIRCGTLDFDLAESFADLLSLWRLSTDPEGKARLWKRLVGFANRTHDDWGERWVEAGWETFGRNRR
jgi:hypothetical protein